MVFALEGKKPYKKGGNLLDRLVEISTTLNLSEDQEIKLTPILNSYAKSMKELFKNIKNASPEERMAKIEKLKSLNNKLISDASSVLSASQQEKFKNLIDSLGKNNEKNGMDRKINLLKEKLKLTDEQTESLAKILQEEMEEMKAFKAEIDSSNNNIFKKARIVKQIKETHESYDLKIKALLSEEQYDKYKEMGKNMRGMMKDKQRDKKGKK